MRHRTYTKIATLLLPILLVLHPGKIEAGIAASIIEGIATEPTQIMNNIELVGINISELLEVYQQLEQLAHEVQMIENQLKNLLQLADDPLALINSLKQLSDVVQRGQVLSYVARNIDEQYANMYPGYSVYISQDLSTSALKQKYKSWSQHNLDNIKAALKACNIQEDTILNEEERLETIVELSKNAEGRLQALQAGNLIAGEQVRSIQRLRQLVMVNSQLQANFQAKEQDKEDIIAAKWQQLTEGESSVVGNESSIVDDF